MSVHTKKDGRHFVVYYDDRGKQAWESFGRGPDAKKRAEIRDLQLQLARRQTVRPARGGSLTFAELAQAYITARQIELADRTRSEILGMLARYALGPIGAVPVGCITIQDWDRIQGDMVAAGLGPKTINIYFSYINRLFTWAVAHEYLPDNPWRRRTRLKQTKYRIELMTPDEFQGILRCAPEHLAWCMEVAYHTGCRPGPGELLALKWSDLDWRCRSIRIYAPKTRTTRYQYLSNDFIRRMRARCKQQARDFPDCPYICHYRGRPLRSLKHSWETAKAEAGISRRIRLYDLRHFYISHALAGGADIMDLAGRVGHVNADMIVNVYAHLVKPLQQRTALAIPKYDHRQASAGALNQKIIQRRSVEKKARETAIMQAPGQRILDKTPLLLDKKG
jgi:integrase